MRYAVATFVAAALAGVSSAWTQPKGPEPIGNPFKTPELATQVPKGKPFEVTWEPTIDKAGTVTILLLRGPSENAVPQYAIAEKIPNSGSFSWTPSNDLEVDTTHYGLQLVVDATGQYQYTPQFGISGKKTSSSSSAPQQSSYEISSVPTPATSRPEEPPKATSTPVYPTVEPSGTAVPPAPSSSKTGPVYLTTTMDVTTCITSSTGSATAPAASGTGAPVPPGNPGLPSAPAGTAPVPGSSGTATAPVPGQSTIATGAAGKTMVASSAAIVAAVFALLL